MLKCKICGNEFVAEKNNHYVARDFDIIGGLSQTVNGKQEGKTYDCFDCPRCRCQVIAQERKRKI